MRRLPRHPTVKEYLMKCFEYYFVLSSLFLCFFGRYGRTKYCVINLFRFFLTRCTQLASSSGNFGMIVPLSIIADVSCARTRSSLLSDLKKVTADCFPQKDIKAIGKIDMTPLHHTQLDGTTE